MLAAAFDTETTDLVGNMLLAEKYQPKIIEFCGFLVNDTGDIVEELDFLCHPGQKLEQVTTNITGLTDKDLEGKPPFSERAADVMAFFKKADRVVAHNLAFDQSMLRIEFQRLGIPLDFLPAEQICTVQETVWLRGFRLNLHALHLELFGEDPAEAHHRAREDVKTLVKCYNELVRRGDL